MQREQIFVVPRISVRKAEILAGVLVEVRSLSSTDFSNSSRRFITLSTLRHGTGRHRVSKLVVSLSQKVIYMFAQDLCMGKVVLECWTTVVRVKAWKAILAVDVNPRIAIT